jgi:hypothetical protein
MTAKQTSTLGQELADKFPNLVEYMGSDIEIAKSIAVLNVLVDLKLVSAESVKLVKALLIEQNRATFASSEKTDNLTKLSLGLGKEELEPADGSQ